MKEALSSGTAKSRWYWIVVLLALLRQCCWQTASGQMSCGFCTKASIFQRKLFAIYYRGSKWEKAVKDSQDHCAQHGISDWKNYCLETFNLQPEPLSPQFKAAIDKMYCVLVNHVSGVNIFCDCPTIDQFLSELEGAISAHRNSSASGAATK